MKKKYFYNKKDVMEMLGAPEKRAKKIIDDLNEELKEKGFLIYDKVVNAKYFNERYNIEQGIYMPAYKDDERGTWYCEFRYKEINGFNRKKKKRGFKTKKNTREIFWHNYPQKQNQFILKILHKYI